MQIDIRKDALLALKTAYERAALYCETGNQDIYRNLTSKIDQVLDNGILNQLDVVQSYKNLKLYMDSKNIVGIKYEIINIQHSIEADNLLWNYTLFLRLFKRWTGMKLKFKNQAFQMDAVNAVVDLFAGQEKTRSTFSVMEEAQPNFLNELGQGNASYIDQ